MKEKAQTFEVDTLLSKIADDEYFNDFLRIRNLEAGVLRLRPGEEDTQTPHDTDELYYVIKGSGYIEVQGDVKPVKQGSIIFVPARMAHHFYGNKDLLIVLYVFSE